MRRWRGGRGAVAALVVGVVALGGGAPAWAAGAGIMARETPFQHGVFALALDQAAGVAVVAGGDQNERQVRLLDPHSGAVRRVVTLPGQLWAAFEFGPTSTLLLDQRRARAYVTTYGRSDTHGPTIGYVNVIDTRRGALMNSAGAVWLRAPGVGGARTGRLTVRGLPMDMTMDERAGRLFVVNQIQTAIGLQRQGSVRVLDGRTGAVVVSETLSGQTPEAVVVDEATGRAFVIGQRTDGLGNPAGPATLSVLDGTSGRVLSTVALPHGGGQPVVATRLGRLFLSTSSGDLPHTGYLTTINTRTGRVIRAAAIEGAAYCAPVAVDETVGRAYLACADGERGPSGNDTAIVHALDAHNGRLLHATAAPGLPRSIVVDSARGHLFLTLSHDDGTGKNDAPGSVAMLDARSGALLHTAAVGRNPNRALLDPRRGRLFVTADGPRATDWPYWPPKGRGSVSVLDAASGGLLDTLPVGVQPGDMALDEGAGRLLVLARGGAIPDRASRVKWVERLVPGSLTIVEQTR